MRKYTKSTAPMVYTAISTNSKSPATTQLSSPSTKNYPQTSAKSTDQKRAGSTTASSKKLTLKQTSSSSNGEHLSTSPSKKPSEIARKATAKPRIALGTSSISIASTRICVGITSFPRG